MDTSRFDKLLGTMYEKSLGRRPPQWHSHTFAVPRKCDFCKETLWGKGRIGYVNWTHDVEVFRAHVACQTLEVLSGND